MAKLPGGGEPLRGVWSRAFFQDFSTLEDATLTQADGTITLGTETWNVANVTGSGEPTLAAINGSGLSFGANSSSTNALLWKSLADIPGLASWSPLNGPRLMMVMSTRVTTWTTAGSHYLVTRGSDFSSNSGQLVSGFAYSGGRGFRVVASDSAGTTVDDDQTLATISAGYGLQVMAQLDLWRLGGTFGWNTAVGASISALPAQLAEADLDNTYYPNARHVIRGPESNMAYDLWPANRTAAASDFTIGVQFTPGGLTSANHTIVVENFAVYRMI